MKHGSSLIDALPEVVAEWERALAERTRAARQREMAVARAQRHLHSALGGMALRSWRNRVGGRVTILTVADGRAMYAARKCRCAVELALQEVADVTSAGNEAMHTAELELSGATTRLLVYGPIAANLTGRSAAELRHMARSGSISI